MNSFVDDFKREWYKPNNIITRLILVNVGVFVVLNLIRLISAISGIDELLHYMQLAFFIPPNALEFLMRPWTLLTYGFTHQGFFHILFNMLVFYWFAQMVRDVIGGQRVFSIYILGVIAGGLSYLLLYNAGYVADFLMVNKPSAGMLGASGAVFALVAAAATLRPNAQIYLLLIGPARLKYVALGVVFLSLIAIPDGNVGGQVAHLGGALVGWLFVVQYQKGREIDRPILTVSNWVESRFQPKAKRRSKAKMYAKKGGSSKRSGRAGRESQRSASGSPDQSTVDRILDKISASGYESLTAEEKQILFRASKK